MDHCWLTNGPVAKIAPPLSDDKHGKRRLDDRRVISGTVPVLKSGGRWAATGVWIELLERLTQTGGPTYRVLIDSTA